MAAVMPKCRVCKKVHPSCGDGSNLYGRPLGFVLANTTYDKYFHLGRWGRKTNALDTLFVGVEGDAALYGGRSEGIYTWFANNEGSNCMEWIFFEYSAGGDDV